MGTSYYPKCLSYAISCFLIEYAVQKAVSSENRMPEQNGSLITSFPIVIAIALVIVIE